MAVNYYQQPDQDFGGGAYDAEDELTKKKPKAAAQPGAPTAAAQPQQPQTFSQMQKSGMARPPMPSLQMAQPGPGMQPMTSTQTPSTGMAPAGPGAIITTTAPAGGPSPWGGATTPPPTGGGTPGNAPPGFDPMEWFRQQVLGGSQNVLERSQAYLGGQIDDDYDVREQRLREEMASRGLADSTVYGGRMQDLNVGRRSAKSDLGERLALEDMNRRTGMVDRMVGMDADTRNYLLQLLGFGYGG